MFASAVALFGGLDDLDELTWSFVNTVKSNERLFAKFLLFWNFKKPKNGLEIINSTQLNWYSTMSMLSSSL